MIDPRRNSTYKRPFTQEGNYLVLLVDHFKWALINGIEQQILHSLLWQFQMGGPSAS